MPNLATVDYVIRTLQGESDKIDTVAAFDAGDESKLGFVSGKGTPAMIAAVQEWNDAFGRAFVVKAWDSRKESQPGKRGPRDAVFTWLLPGTQGKPMQSAPVERIIERGAPIDANEIRKALKAELELEIFGEKLKEQRAEIEALHEELDELAKAPMNAIQPVARWYDTPEGIERVMNAARPWVKDIASMIGIGLKPPTAKATAPTNPPANGSATDAALLTAEQMEALRIFKISDPENYNAVIARLVETYGAEAMKAAAQEQAESDGQATD